MRERGESILDLLVRKAGQHGDLGPDDNAALRSARYLTKKLGPDEDIVRQGSKPDVAVFVVSGMLGRYHTLPNGDRQYLSFHIMTDMPDVQSLHLKIMDHSVCAIDEAEIALFQHEQLNQMFAKHPSIAASFWRITLVDAAIFRQAITNNSARERVPRLAHFFCEQYFRARDAGLADGMNSKLSLNQTQLGQALGMSHISVNRALQALRKGRLLEFRGGILQIMDWPALQAIAGFDPTYLYVS